ncbi:hypothetical protein Tco_0040219, partial [Tanacetum coccineum]
NSDKSLVKELESQVKRRFVKGCGCNTSKRVSEEEPKKVRENNDALIIEDWVSDDEEQQFAQEDGSQRPRGNQRNWNGQKSNQLGCNFVFNNKACFICGSFDHIQYSCPNQQRKRIVSGNNYNKKDNDYYSKTSYMAPRAVLMKTDLKSFNTVRPFYTAHPKSTILCARPRTYFQNQAQSTVHRPFYKRTSFTKRCSNQRFDTGRTFRSTVNTVRARGFNAVKASACWVWRPKQKENLDNVSKHNKDDVEDPSKQGRKNEIDEDHFSSDRCIGSGEARVQQRKRRIQRRVQQKQKKQKDEVFGRILSAKKMKRFCSFISTVSLIYTSRVLKSRFRILFDIHTKFPPLLFWIHPRYHQEELYIHKEEMAPMALSDSKVNNDKSCSKTCLTNYEALKKQYDDLLVKLDDTGFKAATYKRGLATLEEQIIKYREHEVLFSKEIALLKRSVGHKEYQMGLLRDELEKVKQEKEGFEFKIAKFDKSAKDLEQLLASQITDKSKKGFGYNVVPSPHPLILNRPTPLDLSYSGLEEFKEPEVIEYGPRDSSLKSTTGCDKKSENSKKNTDDSLEQHQMTDTQTSSFESPLKVDKDWKEKFFYPANHVREVEPKKVRENNDAPIIEDWVSDDEDDDEPNPKVEKKTVIPTATKKEFVKPEKPVKRSVRHVLSVEVLITFNTAVLTNKGKE